MYHLRRVLISRLGHSSAEYRGNIIPFFDMATEIPAQSLVVAVNGSGKTTAIALMFSVFEPDRRRFVQTLQQREHKYEAYFWDAPGIVAIEMQRTGSLIDPERIVIGYVHAKKRIAANLQPLFFSFRVTPGKTLDELPWPGTQAAKESHVVDWDDVAAWKADWQGRSYGDVGMQCFESQSVWKKHLKTGLGIPLDLITSQIDLARTEGGLSKMFEELSTDEDVVAMLSDMMGLTDKANEKIEEVRESLKSLAAMPLIEKEIKVAEGLIADLEGVDAAAEAVRMTREGVAAVDKDRVTFAGHLMWERDLQSDMVNSLTSQVEAADREAADADGRAALRTAEAECWRVAAAQGMLAEARAREAEHERERAGIEEGIAALSLAVPYKDLREAESKLKTNRSVLDEARIENADKLRPAYEAGTALACALTGEAAREAEAERGARSSQEDVLKLKANDEHIAREADVAIGKAEARKGDRLEAERRIAEFEEEVAAAGFDLKTLLTNRDEAETRLQAADAELNSAKAAIHQAGARVTAASGRLKQAEGELGKARKRHEDGVRKLRERGDAIERFRSDRGTIAVFESTDVDPIDPTTEQRLSRIETEISDSIKFVGNVLREQVGLLDAYRRGSTRQDQDLDNAYRRISDMGINVHYAPDYISKTVRDGAKAGEIVEADPARMFHGLMVDSDKDLERVRQAFDRSDWKLSAPLIVSAISHDVAPPRGYGHVLLSAWSSAAYHEPTRKAEIERLEAEIEKLKADQGRHETRAEQIRAVAKTLADVLAAERNLSMSALRADIEALSGAVEEAVTEVEDGRRELEDAEASVQEARELAAACEEAHSLIKARVDALKDFASRYQEVAKSCHGIETIAELDARIVGLRADLDAAKAAIAGHDRALDGLRKRQDRCRTRKLDFENELGNLKYANRDRVVATHVGSENLETLRADYKGREQVADEGAISIKGLERAVEEAQRAVSEKQAEIDDTDLLSAVAPGRVEHVRETARDHSLRERAAIRSELAIWKAKRATSEDGGRKIASDIAVLGRKAVFERTDAMGSADVDACMAAIAANPESSDPDACEKRRAEATLAAAAARMSAQQSRVVREKASADKRTAEDRLKTIRHALKTLGEGNDVPGAMATEGVIAADEQGVEASVEGFRSRLKTARGALKDASDKLQGQRHKLSQAANRIIAEKISTNAVSLAERLKNMADAVEWHGDIGTRERLENFVASQRHDIKTMEPRKDNVIRGLEHVLITSLSALKRAVKAKIPKKAGRFGDLSVLKCPVSFTDIEAVGHRTIVRPYFEKLLEKYAHVGDGLRITGRDMVVGLLNACLGIVGRDTWEFTLLSPVAQSSENKWQSIHKITGSGGQVLTSAFLLYLVIAEVRSADSGSVFLLLDNPLGVASAKALVQTQISVAEAMGIQIIAMTGIKEYDAMKCFTNVVQARLFKGANRAQVDVQQVGNEVWGSHYNLRFAPEAV